jgi:hypothetical protein
MLCPSCGTQLPASSEFCSQCGSSVERLLLNPPRRREPSKFHLSNWVALAVFLAAAYWLVGFIRSHMAYSAPMPVSHEIAKARHTEGVVNSSVTVGAGNFTSYKFVVPDSAAQAYVDGDFSVNGGFGNTVQVFVADRDSFLKFKGGETSDTFYNSGMMSQNSIRAPLPGPGTYYLVCSNRSSLSAAKTVELNAVLHYMQ